MPPRKRIAVPPEDPLGEADTPEQSDFDDDISADELDEVREQPDTQPGKTRRVLAEEPLLTTLFRETLVERDDPVLHDFVEHVLSPLAQTVGMESAKGGDFAQQKQAAYEAGGHPQAMRDPADYSRDQTMRAHLLNGMLPTLQIARQLHVWGADTLRNWSETTERLFIAGYMLHDYTKLTAVKQAFADEGLVEWHNPDAARIPVIERIFADLCARLKLDAFLGPLGGAQPYLHDLIYIAHNTQRWQGTALSPSLLPRIHTASDVYTQAADASRLADLLAYVARTPRDMAANKAIDEALRKFTFSMDVPGKVWARLTYHHVAENRGVLLNFVHKAVLAALTHEARVPLLFAPSGVVYLERYDALPPPPPAVLIRQIIEEIREKTGEKLMNDGKGARRGNVTLQIDDSYNDYFDLPSLIRQSHKIVFRHIRSNKSVGRLEPVQSKGWASGDNIPPLPTGKGDARLDQIAEWAGFLEVQFRERLGDNGFDLAAWLLPQLGIDDLEPGFRALENDPGARRGGGIKYWWFWAAAHVLNRQPFSPDEVGALLERLSDELAAALPADLPPAARIDETKWADLADYLARVLTIGGAKTGTWSATDEIHRYINAKKARGGRAVCAMCGDVYTVTKPKETVIAFQPGVYTARVKLGASSNTRSLCSICALEQLLRQLFVDNLDSGSRVEEQRVRYLSLYPSYFFTPETLYLVWRFYLNFQHVRFSSDLRRALQDALLAP
ncbi:MAG: type I-D CRISPR-associated protein Cas10d/Csc3, partial [Chloroflexi bacterium]|nr:type I-D CRISPR-associated protein Cas10d/Csc3 [Chloroflexota bacterium]